MIPEKQDRQDWENQYKAGVWNSLGSQAEFAHYTVVAGFIQQMRRPLTLLDVGCGEGVILNYLNLDWISQYSGLDISQTALDRINPKRPQDRLIRSGLEEFEPKGQWDVVLFNEVLYYTREPVRQLQKFEANLNRDGFFVVSMYQKRNPFAYNNRCLRQVTAYFKKASYSVLDSVQVRRLAAPSSWSILAVRPPAAKVTAADWGQG